jgi:DNA-binding response OmpR family regulator
VSAIEKTVLIIDDSTTERAIVQSRLEGAGYSVTTAEDGREGLRRLYESSPDLVILDVVMPELDGWGTLERIRAVSDVPVIMLTGQDEDDERIRGLRGGADDYIGKPFTPEELLARIEAVLRRAPARPEAHEVYADGAVTIDFAALDVTVRGEQVMLTPLELRVLQALVEHRNQVLSRTQLMELAWDEPYTVSDDQVKVCIGSLRKKIERDAAKPELIRTMRGFGYRYYPPS